MRPIVMKLVQTMCAVVLIGVLSMDGQTLGEAAAPVQAPAKTSTMASGLCADPASPMFGQRVCCCVTYSGARCCGSAGNCTGSVPGCDCR